jgi:hypothetical protein
MRLQGKEIELRDLVSISSSSPMKHESMSSVTVTSHSAVDPAVASFVLNSTSDPPDTGVMSPLSPIREPATAVTNYLKVTLGSVNLRVVL